MEGALVAALHGAAALLFCASAGLGNPLAFARAAVLGALVHHGVAFVSAVGAPNADVARAVVAAKFALSVTAALAPSEITHVSTFRIAYDALARTQDRSRGDARAEPVLLAASLAAAALARVAAAARR